MISLTKYPVEIDSGIIKNTFAGFEDVEILFKREDLVINSITQGTDNYILIKVNGDITGELNVGEWAYLYSVATTFIYDFSAKVLSLGFAAGVTTIMLEEQFIEISGGGYINYKQNYFLESKLVDPNNPNILIVPGSITDDGNAKGEISLNVNIPVDLLKQSYNIFSGEITEGRVKFQVKYRESYRDNIDDSFILIENYAIILIFATENCSAETVANALDEPIFWIGYPNALLLAHSDDNAGGERIDVTFSELDINKNVLEAPFVVDRFNLNDYGMLQTSPTSLPGNYEPNTNTQYVKLVFQTTDVSDFDSDDFDNNDFLTT